MTRWLCRLKMHRPHVWFWMRGYVTQDATYCERCGTALETGGRSRAAKAAHAPYVDHRYHRQQAEATRRSADRLAKYNRRHGIKAFRAGGESRTR